MLYIARQLDRTLSAVYKAPQVQRHAPVRTHPHPNAHLHGFITEPAQTPTGACIRARGLPDVLTPHCFDGAMQVGSVVEPLLLELALRLLRCPILEKRLFGLNEMSDMAVRAGRREYEKYVRGL